MADQNISQDSEASRLVANYEQFLLKTQENVRNYHQGRSTEDSPRDAEDSMPVTHCSAPRLQQSLLNSGTSDSAVDDTWNREGSRSLPNFRQLLLSVEEGSQGILSFTHESDVREPTLGKSMIREPDRSHRAPAPPRLEKVEQVVNPLTTDPRNVGSIPSNLVLLEKLQAWLNLDFHPNPHFLDSEPFGLYNLRLTLRSVAKTIVRRHPVAMRDLVEAARSKEYCVEANFKDMFVDQPVEW